MEYFLNQLESIMDEYEYPANYAVTLEELEEFWDWEECQPDNYDEDDIPF